MRLKCNLAVNHCHECHKLGFSSFNVTQPLKALSFKVVHIMISNFFFSVFYTCFYWTEHENEVDEKCRYSLEAWKNQQSLDKEVESHKVKIPMKTYHPEEKNILDQYVKRKILWEPTLQFEFFSEFGDVLGVEREGWDGAPGNDVFECHTSKI